MVVKVGRNRLCLPVIRACAIKTIKTKSPNVWTFLLINYYYAFLRFWHDSDFPKIKSPVKNYAFSGTLSETKEGRRVPFTSRAVRVSGAFLSLIFTATEIAPAYIRRVVEYKLSWSALSEPVEKSCPQPVAEKVTSGAASGTTFPFSSTARQVKIATSFPLLVMFSVSRLRERATNFPVVCFFSRQIVLPSEIPHVIIGREKV